MDISLRLEVKQKDAENIIIWLEDQDVTKYLNEDIRSASSLKTIPQSGRKVLPDRFRKRRLPRIHQSFHDT